MTYSCRLCDIKSVTPYVQKQINKWIDPARQDIMLQYWGQLFTFSVSKPFCSRESHLCFPNHSQKLRKAFVTARLFPWPRSSVCPNSRSVRACPVSQKYLETMESCPKALHLLYVYLNRSYEANKIRCSFFFFFLLAKHEKSPPNNEAVNVTVDLPLLQEVSWASLHVHVRSFHAFSAVSRFQVVFDTFIVMWVVP